MSHGLVAARKAERPDRCPCVFVPNKRGGGGLNYRRTCLCGQKRGHSGQHVCPDCGGRWGTT